MRNYPRGRRSGPLSVLYVPVQAGPSGTLANLRLCKQQSLSPAYVHRDLQAINDTTMKLPDLCEKITQFAALGRLNIVASECYVSRTLVRHRYLLLECRFGRTTMWFRLDRRRSVTSNLSFLLASSGGPANDTASSIRYIKPTRTYTKVLPGRIVPREEQAHRSQQRSGESSRVHSATCCDTGGDETFLCTLTPGAYSLSTIRCKSLYLQFYSGNRS